MYHVSAQGLDERMINVHYYHSKLPCVRYISVPPPPPPFVLFFCLFFCLEGV